MKKAKKVKSHRVLVISSLVVGGLVLGMAVAAAQKPVHYTPKAYVQSQEKTIDSGTNNPPSISGSSFVTIRCQTGQECRHTFEGSDSDLYDTLTFTVDFLPENLNLTTCQTSQSLTGNKKVSCQLAGTPNRTGTYKLLASLSDGSNPPTTKTFTLNVD